MTSPTVTSPLWEGRHIEHHGTQESRVLKAKGPKSGGESKPMPGEEAPVPGTAPVMGGSSEPPLQNKVQGRLIIMRGNIRP